MIAGSLNMYCDAISGDNSTKRNFDSTPWNGVVSRDVEKSKHCMVLEYVVLLSIRWGHKSSSILNWRYSLA